MLKKAGITKKIKITLLAGGLFALGCSHFTQQTLPQDAGGDCLNSLTPAQFNTWFVSGAVSLGGAVKPANSVLFSPNSLCSFYQWSAQMFLWLTSPAPPTYGGGGLVMNTSSFYDVSMPDASGYRHFVPHTAGMIRAFNLRTAQKGSLDLPVLNEKGTLRLLQILPPVKSASGKQMVLDKDGQELEVGSIKLDADKHPVLMDMNGKEIQQPKAFIQSVRDSTVTPLLMRMNSIPKFDRTSLVQKITFDKITVFLDLFGNFHEEEQGQADGSVLMSQNKSLVYYSITVNNVYELYRTMQTTPVANGTDFPTTQPQLNAISAFAIANGKSPVIDSEALAIEIKCSWVLAAGLADTSKFIKMEAEVPVYDTSNPNDWKPNGTKVVLLAMTGMHVVGSVAGHPELLWSTFEQVSNDPVATYTYVTNSSPPGTNTITQNTVGVWNFCSNGAPGPAFNTPHMQMDPSGATQDIVSIPPFRISPTDILRSMPFGMPGNDASSNSEVICINNVVRNNLNPNDVRVNYIQTGTTWTIGGQSPENPGSQVGTNVLANTTMETFVQGNNCFMCHNSNTTHVSHVFDTIKP